MVLPSHLKSSWSSFAIKAVIVISVIVTITIFMVFVINDMNNQYLEKRKFVIMTKRKYIDKFTKEAIEFNLRNEETPKISTKKLEKSEKNESIETKKWEIEHDNNISKKQKEKLEKNCDKELEDEGNSSMIYEIIDREHSKKMEYARNFIIENIEGELTEEQIDKLANMEDKSLNLFIEQLANTLVQTQ